MPRRKLRKHAPEFKFKLVVESLRGEQTRTEIARENDITKSLLYKWEQAFLEQGSDVFRSADLRTQELAERDQRIAGLERLVGRLALENEVLKKFETQLNSTPHKNGR
ncbi:MAG: transposase [Ardenticatenaceae bacterium]|nr:transposase [Ardenticatenaceae bacterium]